MTTSSVALGTSNLRGSSRPVRISSSRALRTARSAPRQNSLISNPATSTHVASEPHGFYPAVTAFTDAIAALPRDFRRHESLLKEVDAKAWFLEESLQNLLAQGLVERHTQPTASAANTISGSTANLVDGMASFSATNSINGVALDNMSQFSNQSTDPGHLRRRQLYMALRHNLMQMMVTMDEKNHVINNANEDLSKHVRRLDTIWPHIAEELSEEARLGSLKHWAYTETNPVVKKQAATISRREAGSSLAILTDNDIAHRSESRREAMLAKKQRLNQHLESDFDDKAGRRTTTGGKNRKPDMLTELAAVGMTAPGRRKTAKSAGGVAMERTASSRTGGVAMSRETSQQDNTKKRKAPATAGTNARKRLYPGTHESPKLISSPLANVAGREAVKRSPAMAAARPVARGRQNSGQGDATRNKPSSSIARNTNGLNNSAMAAVMTATGRSAIEVSASIKESTNSKGDKLLEDRRSVNGETLRGGILLERTASKQGGFKKEAQNGEKAASSPRIGTTGTTQDNKLSRGRLSKVSTPVIGTFKEAEAENSGNGNGSDSGTAAAALTKPKRLPRPRMKDHHGLQDSLSPKGLPSKRTHNKTASFSSLSAQPLASKPNSSRARDRERERDRNQDMDENSVATHSNATTTTLSSSSRSNSRNNNSKENNQMFASISSNSQSFASAQPAGTRGRQGDAQSSDEENDPRVADPNTDADTGQDQDQDQEDDPEADADVDPDDDDMEDLESDERYCLCNGPSYGEMVACDNKDCPREWFHLGCIGLKKLPSAAKWYCDECKEDLSKRGRFVG